MSFGFFRLLNLARHNLLDIFVFGLPSREFLLGNFRLRAFVSTSEPTRTEDSGSCRFCRVAASRSYVRGILVVVFYYYVVASVIVRAFPLLRFIISLDETYRKPFLEFVASGTAESSSLNNINSYEICKITQSIT